jgi:homoserine kinase type II
MRVFLAWHTTVDPDSEDSKLLGIYSSDNAAQAAIDRVRGKPGFRRYPDGFEISEYEVDGDSWTEGFGFED